MPDMQPRVFTVLGGLAVRIAHQPVGLGIRTQRAVRAALLLAEGDVVRVDRLADVLWSDVPPEASGLSAHAYLARLRSALEPDAPPRAPAERLLRRGVGCVRPSARTPTRGSSTSTPRGWGTRPPWRASSCGPRPSRGEIDAENRLARVHAGATWGAVLDRAQEHGPAPLVGATTDVGAVGYTSAAACATR
jgi:hypothetical protein